MLNKGREKLVEEAQNDAPHRSVLLAEVLDALQPLDGAHVIDATFGAGGYSRALLAAGAQVTGMDRDPNVMTYVDPLKAEYPDRFDFVSGQFSQLDRLVTRSADAIVFDIGVSSMQLDEAERGFSFMRDGPLDMRMGGTGPSAGDLVNRLEEAELANLLFSFGEERKSRRIAKAIVSARADKEISGTLELATLIEKTIGRKPGSTHPATKSFQALRIAVNAEFDELVSALFAAEAMLENGGRLAVVAFHSLEDRIVKRFFAQEGARDVRSRHLPQVEEIPKRWDIVAKAVKPGKSEISANPRARSAILRQGVRSNLPARTLSYEGLGVPGYKLETAL